MDARTTEGTSSQAVAEPSFLSAIRTIYELLSRARKRHFWLVLLLSLLGGLAELVTIGAIVPFLTLLTSREAQLNPGVLDFFDLLGAGSPDSRLLAATGLFIAAALIAGAVRFFLAWSSLSFVQRLGHEVAIEIQRRVLLQSYEYHLRHNSSELIAALELVDQLAYGVIQQLIQALAASVIVLFIAAAVAAIDASTALFAAAAFGLAYALIAVLFRKRLRDRSKVIAVAFNERVRLLQESVGGIRDVIVDHAQDAHVEAFREADGRLTRARTETALASVAPRFLIESAGMVVLALIALGLSRSAGGLAAALPVIGALALGAQRLLPLANQLYQGWSLAAANSALAGQVAELLRLPLPPREETGNRLSFRQGIRFRDVSLTYPGRKRPALEQICLTIPRGGHVALSGPTGSGKSSLADLLMGLLEPTAGKIELDGVTLDAASRRAWQHSIAHVPQSIFLIDASIARNIALSAPDIPLDMARAAAAASVAQLDGFLATLPEGLDTIVGERGVRLSGGQRQRIGIARALYKQAPVLILDEATSALDEETETGLLRALFASRDDLTILLIAHRQSTLDCCGLQLRLEHGRLVETAL
jgi:ABC-type multidrug transport system fused ATPase/permease subunit